MTSVVPACCLYCNLLQLSANGRMSATVGKKPRAISFSFHEVTEVFVNATFSTTENLKFEVRARVNFLTKLGWNANAIIEALGQVYGNRAPSKRIVYEWIKRFKKGWEDIEDDHRSSQPFTSISEEPVAAAQAIVDADRRVPVEIVAHQLGISDGSAYSILTDRLGLSKLSMGWVPKALREDHRAQR